MLLFNTNMVPRAEFKVEIERVDRLIDFITDRYAKQLDNLYYEQFSRKFKEE